MPTGVITNGNVVNFSGLLFIKGNTKVPFSTMIANKAKSTNSTEFVTGQEYQTDGGTQPAISETASLTAPAGTYVTRAQKTNVTQIFQEALDISYAKQSNMGTLSGLNIAGQQANPINELDFQTAAKMAKIARDIEYTFIRGSYHKSTGDSDPGKTRGILEAIQSNIIDLNGEAVRIWDIAEALKVIYDAQAPTSGLVLWVDPVALFQLNADAEANGNTIVPAGRDINGISISTLLTPMGSIGLYLGEFLPAGTIAIFNPDVIARVEQETPGKGNFFREELAKTGAGTKYQIFGQLGLDHGPEWYHAKITGINTNFVKPKAGRKIYAVDPLPTTNVLPEIDTVTFDVSPVVGTATSALGITYVGVPASAATLAYQWKIASSANGTYADIAGATSATYTPIAGDVDKYIKCEVTASGTATGTAVSNAKKVLAAG
jgi:hypothetical protein